MAGYFVCSVPSAWAMIPSPTSPPTVRDNMVEPPCNVAFSPSSIACMTTGTPAMTNTFSTWNPGAPGFQVENVFVMAGVPVVMQAMLDGLKATLQGGSTMLSRTVGGEVGEGIIAQALGTLQTKYPAIDIGSYPFYRPGAPGR